MDNFEYLNQISQSNRPTKRSFMKPKGGLKTSMVVKLVAGGIVLFFLLMAFGSMLGNLGNKSSELTKQVYVRTTNLNQVVTTFNRDLKSSQLRAIGTSLATVLTNTSNQLSAYLVKDGKDKNALIPDTKTTESEAALTDELNTTLTNAKLNGVLDRFYDNQIGLQVSLLMAQVSELNARTKDSELKQILLPFYSSLSTIHQSFESFESN